MLPSRVFPHPLLVSSLLSTQQVFPSPHSTTMTSSTMSAPTPRRRHSGSAMTFEPVQPAILKAAKAVQYTHVDPIPRPKSTPADERDRPLQRKRVYDLGSSASSDSENEEESHDSTMAVDAPAPGRQVPFKRESPQPAANNSTPIVNHRTSPSARPTRPLPSSKSRKMLHNPSMLPEQAQVPRGPNAAGQRRLFVILEQACLEAYKVGTVTKGRNGREGEAKYALLNCDDHQGILAKTGRDIADARPDITHQVCLLPPFYLLKTTLYVC